MVRFPVSLFRSHEITLNATISLGIGKDHRIPLAELKCMSPKRVKELDLHLDLGCAARRRGEEPGRAPRIKSAHGRRPLFRPGP
jgi:hypothetical protein